MPDKPVIVDTSIVAVGVKPTAYQNIGIVGQDSGGSAADNIVMELTTLADVATYFGSTTDIYKAAQRIFALGVARVWCVRATQTDVAAEVVTEGSEQSLANGPPISGRTLPTAGTATFAGFVYEDPVLDPGASKFAINAKTGKIFVEGGVTDTINYSYVGWTAAIAALADYPIRIVVLANHPMGATYYGDLDDFITNGCDVKNWVMPVMSESALTSAEVIIDIGKYSSKNIMGVSHNDTTLDVAAIVAAKMSLTQPWDKMMWKTIPSVTMVTYWTSTEIAAQEAAKCNAIIKKGDYDVLSDGLTSVGGDYKFIDITRTQYYLEDNFISALESLIQNNSLPYEPSGLGTVKSTLAQVCDEAVSVGALREPFLDTTTQKMQNGYTIEMPDFGSIADADKTNRILNSVYVTVWLAGHIQQITMNLEIQL